MSTDQDFGGLDEKTGLTRRRLFELGGASAAAVAGAGFLGACGGSASSTTQSASTVAAGSPVRGGVLRFGCQGGGTTDSLDAQNYLLTTDAARISALYDPLVRMNEQGLPRLQLAESLTPNKTATEWTVRLRSGVQFHDGKTLDSQDVLFSFQRILKNQFPGATLLGTLNPKTSKALVSADRAAQVRSALCRPAGGAFVPLVPLHRAGGIRSETPSRYWAIPPGQLYAGEPERNDS